MIRRNNQRGFVVDFDQILGMINASSHSRNTT